jgi:hypothetical protein
MESAFPYAGKKPENNQYLPRKYLVQIRAILHHNIWLLDGICALGKRKMRAQHGA